MAWHVNTIPLLHCIALQHVPLLDCIALHCFLLTTGTTFAYVEPFEVRRVSCCWTMQCCTQSRGV
jgi:hypothetical protein